jgi:hypothetical protein
MTAPSRRGGVTPAELRLVEEYVWVLDFVSRCALGIDRGDWFYLYDKAGELATAAGRLSQLAAEAYQASILGQALDPRPSGPRWPGRGRHYRAGRLLHPHQPRGRR